MNREGAYGTQESKYLLGPAEFFLLEIDEIVKFSLQFMNFVHLFGVVVLKSAILLLLEFFEFFELRVEFVVPWVEHHDLEGQGRRPHDKTDDG